ncbi:MAG: chromosome segregation protein SMC [Chloroflexota bacterium]
MSRLKALRLHGFKTFADPTVFAFEHGVNAVMGPNGSGKSNMADAVRWVLGEQSNRSLRTRRADDVIFAGSQSRKPQGMAEAILTLDNHDRWLPIDFAEVTVGRRAYRSGDSEYLLNGARVRLRDITELLGEGRLGASSLIVVGQGTVDAALSLRPEERRQLFEEAAGVKNLQVRKNEALGRLAKAADNLTRMTDLVAELRPQVRRLAQQAQHQQQHDALLARARSFVGESHHRRERGGRASLADARRRAAAAEAALARYRDEQRVGREAVEAAEAAYWEAEARARAAAEAREATREARIRLEGRVEGIALRRRELHTEIERSERALAESRSDLGGTAADDDAAVAPAIERARAAEAAYRHAIGALAAADDALVTAEDALAGARRQESEQIAVAARQGELAARARTRIERFEVELAALGGVERDASAALEPAQRSAGQRAAERARAASALAEATAALDAAAPATDTARRAAAALAERIGVMRGELAALTERVEHGGRLGTLLSAAGWRTLLDDLDAPREAWPAIEAVVGGELEHALVWRDDDLVDRLAEARGAARLLAPFAAAAVEGREAALRAVGAARTLAEWTGAASPPQLLQRTAVAPDVGALLRGWRRLPPGWCAVTPDGDLADGRGLVTLRGRAGPQGGEAARQHARRRELTEAIDALEADHAQTSETAARQLAALGAAQRAAAAAREAEAEAERGERAARGEADAAEAALRRAAGRRAAVEQELALARAELSEAHETPGAEPASQSSALHGAARTARAARDAAAGERDTTRAAWQASRGAAEELEARSAGRRQRVAALEGSVTQLETALPALREREAAVVAELELAERELDGARAADEVAGTTRADHDAERDRRRTGLLELERGASGAATRLLDLERSASSTATEVMRHEEALAAVERERRLALDALPEADDEAAAAAATAPDPDLERELADASDDTIETETRRVRRLLAQIGSVNPFAVEEHRELAERLDGLSGQETDLQAAIASTRELITRLDTEINERFNAAFTAIGARFDEFVRLLFAGGSAALQLDEEGGGEAPGGIEIVVRPPGKRLQRLAMLSGGERALTGVALLFAMLSVNPVPFCILDEVDAALDEANIGRFAGALRKLAESIDFVVITHNRATIETADTIYGVTMTDAAVSRVLSLRLADLPVEVTA